MGEAVRTPVDPFSELGFYLESHDYPKVDFTQMEFRGPVDTAALSEAYTEALGEFPVYRSHLREAYVDGRPMPSSSRRLISDASV